MMNLSGPHDRIDLPPIYIVWRDGKFEAAFEARSRANFYLDALVRFERKHVGGSSFVPLGKRDAGEWGALAQATEQAVFIPPDPPKVDVDAAIRLYRRAYRIRWPYWVKDGDDEQEMSIFVDAIIEAAREEAEEAAREKEEKE